MLQIAMNQINVTNLEEAIKWYTNTLGFELSKENYFPPQAVDLIQKGNIRLILYKVDKKVKNDYPNQTQTIIIFRTENLEKLTEDLKKKNVAFVYPEAIEFPAGIFNAIIDPFGNVLEIVQLE
ncbi:MAG TPA: VOC family protein [candidate division Zixibacteria bacterium]|nr:VOC family protein [candidate division Zixibacteria bacterium]